MRPGVRDVRLTYRDGTEADDAIFDEELGVQRQMVARDMNLNPNDPDSWPIAAIDALLGLRKVEGEMRYHKRLWRMFNP